MDSEIVRFKQHNIIGTINYITLRLPYVTSRDHSLYHPKFTLCNI